MVATASSNLSLRRPVMNTWAPSATNSLAVASAIPDVAPVITATLPSSLGIRELTFLSVVVRVLVVGATIGPAIGAPAAPRGFIVLICFTPRAVKSEHQDEAPLRSLLPI